MLILLNYLRGLSRKIWLRLVGMSEADIKRNESTALLTFGPTWEFLKPEEKDDLLYGNYRAIDTTLKNVTDDVATAVIVYVMGGKFIFVVHNYFDRDCYPTTIAKLIVYDFETAKILREHSLDRDITLTATPVSKATEDEHPGVH